jgi:hypothetical protein
MTIDVHDLVNVWEFHIQQIFFLSVFCEYFFWRPQIGVPKEFIQLILSLCSPQDLFIWFFAWFFFRVYTMMTIHSLYWGLLMAVISFGSIFFQQIFFSLLSMMNNLMRCKWSAYRFFIAFFCMLKVVYEKIQPNKAIKCWIDLRLGMLQVF